MPAADAPKGLRQALYDRIWSAGVRVRDLGKRLGISGPVEPLLMHLGPRLMPPPKQETCIALPAGDQLWIPPGFTSYRNYRLGLYERDLYRLLPSLVTPGMTVLDVGSNIGYYSIVLSRLVRPGGSVFAFEVDDLAAGYLERNLALNHCDNVTAVKLAVADRADELSFVPDGIDRGYVDRTAGRPGSKIVKSITLDGYFESLGRPQIDFVKLDIEGGESAALTGMSRLCAMNPSMSIVMELNQDNMRRAGVTERQLLSQLAGLGFRTGYVIERNLEPFPLDRPPDSGGAMYNLLISNRAPARP